MCGIVYIEDFFGRPVNSGILHQFQAQRHRGTEGFGLFDGSKGNLVRATKENRIRRWLKRYDSDMILFHHRYPTSTINVKRAAHPLSTKDYFGTTTYVLVHNGIIRNDAELYVAHQDRGIEYHTLLEDMTFNDSESLLWDMALYLEGKQAAPQALGDMAFIIQKLVNNKPERLYFYTNGGRPLNFWRTDQGIMLSSEGEGDPTPEDVLYNWNHKLKRLSHRPLTIKVCEPYVYTPITTYQPRIGFQNWEDDLGEEAYTPTRATERNDDAAYLAWWKTLADKNIVDKGKPGDWLDDHLRAKYTHFFNKDGTVRDEPVPLVKDEHGLYVPATDRKTGERVYVARQQNYPTEDEIEQVVMAYLTAVQGHFEQAHWAIEGDYEQAEGLPQTPTVIREKVLLDLALQSLDADPEYLDQDSVSNYWRVLNDKLKEV